MFRMVSGQRGVFSVNVCQELRKINTKFLWFGTILTGGIVCSTDGAVQSTWDNWLEARFEYNMQGDVSPSLDTAICGYLLSTSQRKDPTVLAQAEI